MVAWKIVTLVVFEQGVTSLAFYIVTDVSLAQTSAIRIGG